MDVGRTRPKIEGSIPKIGDSPGRALRGRSSKRTRKYSDRASFPRGPLLALKARSPSSQELSMRANRFLRHKATFLVGAGVLAVISGQQFGCSSGSNSGGSSTEQGGTDGIGTVHMNLTLPGGESISTVNWVITGPNKAPTVVQQGQTHVKKSDSISISLGCIFLGTGYSVSLPGTSVDGTVTCAGSATFSVTSRQTTS